MKRYGLALVLAVVFSVGALAGDDWLTDFEKARKTAADKGLPILADFSGSDWCGWCMRLEKEVLSQKEFKEFAEKNVVLFVADFPSKKKLPPKLEAQNKELAERYGVRGFPTVLLLDSDGKVIARTGYRAGGATEYVKHLAELIAGADKG